VSDLRRGPAGAGVSVNGGAAALHGEHAAGLRDGVRWGVPVPFGGARGG